MHIEVRDKRAVLVGKRAAWPVHGEARVNRRRLIRRLRTKLDHQQGRLLLSAMSDTTCRRLPGRSFEFRHRTGVFQILCLLGFQTTYYR